MGKLDKNKIFLRNIRREKATYFNDQMSNIKKIPACWRREANHIEKTI